MLIGVVFSLRYELAIPLQEDDQDAANIVAPHLWLVYASTLLSVLSVLSVIFFAKGFAGALDVPKLDYGWRTGEHSHGYR